MAEKRRWDIFNGEHEVISECRKSSEAKQGKGMSKLELLDGYWAGGVVEVVVGISSETNAFEGAVDIFWWRMNIEKLNERELFEIIV